MRWADPIRLGIAVALATALGGCAAGGARNAAYAVEPVKAAATLAAPPTDIAAQSLPPDSLVIRVTGRNAYTVQDATATCEGLRDLLEPYRERNLVVAGSEGFAATIADALCIARIAKARGGTAYLTHPEGLRTIEIQD